jgi:hypothetical protein
MISIEELEDMVSLRRNVTGVDATVFVSTKGYGPHAPACIQIAVGDPASLNARAPAVPAGLGACWACPLFKRRYAELAGKPFNPAYDRLPWSADSHHYRYYHRLDAVWREKAQMEVWETVAELAVMLLIPAGVVLLLLLVLVDWADARSASREAAATAGRFRAYWPNESPGPKGV